MTADRRPYDDGIIIGGDTPFVPFSEAARVFPQGHRPLQIAVDGQEATRVTFVAMCAMMRRLTINGECPLRPGDPPLDEFMRQFIAGANHDLRAAGLGPLISIAEVERLSEHPQIVAACVKGTGKADDH